MEDVKSEHFAFGIVWLKISFNIFLGFPPNTRTLKYLLRNLVCKKNIMFEVGTCYYDKYCMRLFYSERLQRVTKHTPSLKANVKMSQTYFRCKNLSTNLQSPAFNTKIRSVTKYCTVCFTNSQKTFTNKYLPE